jgi:hypothetical protein
LGNFEEAFVRFDAPRQRCEDVSRLAFADVGVASRGVALFVHVDEQDALTHSCELVGEVDGQGRLPDAALLVCDADGVHDCHSFRRRRCFRLRIRLRFFVLEREGKMRGFDAAEHRKCPCLGSGRGTRCPMGSRVAQGAEGKNKKFACSI